MEIPLYQVDAFTSSQFAGNPAAVCPLESWLPAKVMQAIAAENNLAETAFIVRTDGRFEIRWFTPEIEVDLCGHATLASAYVLRKYLGYLDDSVVFQSKSGELLVTLEGDRLCLDFPALPPKPCTPHIRLVDGLGTQPVEILGAKDYLAVFADASEVLTLQPNFDVLRTIDRRGVVVTAPGDDVDFVSRFFAPGAGVDEDPVTGSAHCMLTPYWSRRLKKQAMSARQLSRRGGDLWVEDCGERVKIAGYVAPYLRGVIQVG